MVTGHPILCLNSGSSSLKFALYQVGANEEALLAEGAVERIGMQGGHLWIRGAEKILADVYSDFPEHLVAVQATFSALEKLNLPQPVAVGHRVVHGGTDHAAPERVDARLLDTLRGLVALAPLHLPCEIQVIEAVATRLPGLAQVACFDTAFHRRMPELAQRFPLPGDLWNEGLRRYGFHGLSYEYVVEKLGSEAQSRAIIAHLGNGASMAAVRWGKPLDTTMGFTPTGGFMMGTRSGDLDPGILLYLMNEKGYDSRRLERLVNNQAGLLGVSGLTPDMKTLLEKRESEPDANQAVEMFCYQIRKHIGALTAVLGGLDTLVFTGGIGERAAPVRWDVCQGLEYLGVHLNPRRNEVHADTISTSESPCTVRVIATNEDLMIARYTQKLIFPSVKNFEGSKGNA
ncbi:MAG: acetate/propionate family kinase [candidate division NC10 bacterium]|nr:acetate/propionate family kinase [candidate division NC10 bacterium]